MNLKSIARRTGKVLLLQSAAMAVCLGISVVNGDPAAAALLLSMALVALVGTFPLIFVRKENKLTPKEGVSLMLPMLVFTALYACLPYWMWSGSNLMSSPEIPVSLQCLKYLTWMLQAGGVLYCLAEILRHDKSSTVVRRVC